LGFSTVVAEAAVEQTKSRHIKVNMMNLYTDDSFPVEHIKTSHIYLAYTSPPADGISARPDITANTA
jgi:hypothetical protein